MIVLQKVKQLSLLSILWKVHTSHAEQCLNARGNFKVKQQRYSCKSVQKNRALCYSKPKFMRKCPALCGQCECKDTEGPFFSVIKGKLNCKKVSRKKDSLCTDKNARYYCPDACGMCEHSFIVAPTSAPKAVCKVEAILSSPPISSSVQRDR